MLHLLVVDDDPMVCQMVSDFLREEVAAYVDCARSGTDGAVLLKGYRYDLAVIDTILPGVDGFQLAELAANENTPVLLMCGHPVACGRLEQYGFPHLKKPFNLDILGEEAAGIIRDTRENLHRVRTSVECMRIHTDELKVRMADSRRLIAAATASVERSELVRMSDQTNGKGTTIGRP